MSEDGEVDLVGMSSQGSHPFRALPTASPSRQNAIGLPLHQRSSQGPASPAVATTRLEIVLGVASQPRPTLHLSNTHSPSPHLTITSDLGPKAKHEKLMAPSAASLGVEKAAKLPKTPATVAASKPTEDKLDMRRLGRGRPVGWKPGMSYSGKPLSKAEQAARIERFEQMQKNKPAKRTLGQDGDTIRKKRGRSAKSVPAGPRGIYEMLHPSFIPFGCEWVGCKAELQNMATLRKHVKVVHRRAELCHWGKCAKKGHPVKLITDDEFESHMETAHLVPYQWHMGDGYQNRVVVPKTDPQEVPLYLLDENGQQVTPSTKDQEIEDFATWKANRRRLRELLILRDENAPLEDENGNIISE